MATATSDQMASLRRQATRPNMDPRSSQPSCSVWCAPVFSSGLAPSIFTCGWRDTGHPDRRPLFLADAVGGLVLAAVLLVWPRPLAGSWGGFMISTLGGLILSLNVGLFGFRESFEASFVVETIILESVGALALLAWTAPSGGV